jgi:hypothetical protein
MVRHHLVGEQTADAGTRPAATLLRFVLMCILISCDKVRPFAREVLAALVVCVLMTVVVESSRELSTCRENGLRSPPRRATPDRALPRRATPRLRELVTR